MKKLVCLLCAVQISWADTARPTEPPPVYLYLRLDSSWMRQGFKIESLFRSDADDLLDSSKRKTSSRSAADLAADVARNRAAGLKTKIDLLANQYVDPKKTFFESLGFPTDISALVEYQKKCDALPALDSLKRKRLLEVFYAIGTSPEILIEQEKLYNGYVQAMRAAKPETREYQRNKDLAVLTMVRAAEAARRYIYFYRNGTYNHDFARATVREGLNKDLDGRLDTTSPDELTDAAERFGYYFSKVTQGSTDFPIADKMKYIRMMEAEQNRDYSYHPEKDAGDEKAGHAKDPAAKPSRLATPPSGPSP